MSTTRSPAGRATGVIVGLLAALFVGFLLVPVVALLGGGAWAGVRALGTDHELRASLVLTVGAATAAALLAIIGGTPLAWLMARRSFPGRTVIAALLDVPLVIPHPVAGIALLLALGRTTQLGRVLAAVGLRVVGSPFGVVVAMLFVAAPLYVSGAREAFARVEPRLERVARTLGDSPWRAFHRVTLPLALRGLAASTVVTWARAVSEFGAVVVLVYNPRVASVLAYDRLTTGGLPDALPVAGAIIVLSIAPLVLLRVVNAAAVRDAFDAGSDRT